MRDKPASDWAFANRSDRIDFVVMWVMIVAAQRIFIECGLTGNWLAVAYAAIGGILTGLALKIHRTYIQRTYKRKIAVGMVMREREKLKREMFGKL